MVSRQEIHDALSPLNGVHFTVPSIDDYVDKLLSHARFLEERSGSRQVLDGFLAWYESETEYFISMVWTRPDRRGDGLAGRLISQLIQSTGKDIALEVHRDNPAKSLYESKGFEVSGSTSEQLKMRRPQRVAVMQPYFLPYLGYFNLIHSSTRFVFLDDVNLSKQRWVNRNRILLAGKPHPFTVPLAHASSFRNINETAPKLDPRWARSWLATIRAAYGRTLCFDQVYPRLERLLRAEHRSIADLAIMSIVEVFEHLQVPFSYSRSSISFAETREMPAAQRLACMTKAYGCSRYINLPGGRSLYTNEDFCKLDVRLDFIEPKLSPYAQQQPGFTPGLSILDLIMNLPPQESRKRLGDYTIP